MARRSSERSLAVVAARAADDRKARDVRVWDVRRQSTVSDYVVLCTVEAPAHLDAVEDELRRRIREEFDRSPGHVDGRTRAGWTVVDYGGVVVHVMTESARTFYDLERLWEGARAVPWSEARRAAAPARAPHRKVSQ
jgi:ribosome-associated protein